MEFRATARHARISPTKARLSAALIRGKAVTSAIEILRFEPRRGSMFVRKVLESAVANAVSQANVDPNRLTVVDARVDKGLTLKRWRPASKGRAASRYKRCSHITVAVAEAVDAKV
jgi:large subunit ribosomal protein L22